MAEGVTVAVNMNTSQVSTGLAAMRKEFDNTRQSVGRASNETRNFVNAQRNMQRETAKSGNNMLQLAYAVDDAQYGMRGLMNNIPMLAQSMGLSAGLAGSVAIAAVVINSLIDAYKGMGTGSKQAILDQVALAQTVENASARIVAAKRAIEEHSKHEDARVGRNEKQSQKFSDTLESQKDAIDAELKMLRERQKLQQELADAEKGLESARVNASGDPAAVKLEKEFDIQKRYHDKSLAMKKEMLAAEEMAASRKTNIEDRAIRDAEQRAAYLEEAKKKQSKNEAELTRLKDEEISNASRAHDLYRSLSVVKDPKTDISKMKPEEVLDLVIKAYPEDKLQGAGIGASAMIERARQQKLAIDLAEAESKAGNIAKEITSYGDPEKDAKAANDKKRALKDQLETIKLQKESVEKISAIEAKTMEQKKQADRENLLKAAIEASMKETAVVDSITKIGGGGFIGKTESTTIQERILLNVKRTEEHARQANALLQKVIDKYPSYQP